MRPRDAKGTGNDPTDKRRLSQVRLPADERDEPVSSLQHRDRGHDAPALLTFELGASKAGEKKRRPERENDEGGVETVHSRDFASASAERKCSVEPGAIRRTLSSKLPKSSERLLPRQLVIDDGRRIG